MNRMLSGPILVLLLVSVWTATFIVQPAKASEATQLVISNRPQIANSSNSATTVWNTSYNQSVWNNRTHTWQSWAKLPPGMINPLSSFEAPSYDEQLILSFTQDFSSLAYSVDAVAQKDSSGYGPAYLLNGLTNQGYWYQVGVSYCWPFSSSGVWHPSSGFRMVYEVFDPTAKSIFPTDGGGGAVNFSGTVKPGDMIDLTLHFASGRVVMSARDRQTGASASRTYSTEGADQFIGTPDWPCNAEGFFTGLMTEWCHDNPYFSNEQEVVYSTRGSALSSAWMSIAEWNPNTNEVLFADEELVSYSDSTLQKFDLSGATEYSNSIEFVTGLMFDFQISATPSSQLIIFGIPGYDTAQYEVDVIWLSGNTQNVSLTCSTPMSGITCSFDSASGDPTFTTNLYMQTSLNEPPGNYTLTVTGTGGGQTHKTTVQLIIVAAVYIEPNGTVHPSTAHIQRLGNFYLLTSNIEGSIIVQSNNIVLNGRGYTVQGEAAGPGICLAKITNVTIENFVIRNFDKGIHAMYSSSNNNITQNTLINNNDAVYLDVTANENSITQNTIQNNTYGLYLSGSSNNKIYSNTLSGNTYGIALSGLEDYGSNNNKIYHNNFLGNTNQTLDTSNFSNYWDNSYPSGGNYWSSYVGTDANGDGIGDTPYIIDKNNLDRYPLTSPWNPVYMCDSFESGSFNKWNGTHITSGDSAVVTTALKHHGSFSAKFTTNGNGGIEQAYCYENITATSELYARAYFYVSKSGIAAGNEGFWLINFLYPGSDGVAYAGWKMVNGTVRWALAANNGNVKAFAYSTSSPQLNQWYCVELHWKKDPVNGSAEMWVDGVKVCSLTNMNTAKWPAATVASFGLYSVNQCGPTTLYCDCVQMSTAYISPEPVVTLFSVSPNPFSPNGDGSKDTTRITATFNVAVRWHLQIRNSSGDLLRQWIGTGNVSIVWDGKNSLGSKVHDGTYAVILSGTDFSGISFTSKIGNITVDTKPPIISNGSVYPTSFNPGIGQATRINYTLSKSCYVTIGIYNSKGTLVRTLMNNALQPSGAQRLIWNGKTSLGIIVPTGTYTIKVLVTDKAGNRAIQHPLIKTVGVT